MSVSLGRVQKSSGTMAVSKVNLCKPSTLGLDDNKICSSPTISPSRLILLMNSRETNILRTQKKCVFVQSIVYFKCSDGLNPAVRIRSQNLHGESWQCGGVLAASYKRCFCIGLLHLYTELGLNYDTICLSVVNGISGTAGCPGRHIYAIQVIHLYGLSLNPFQQQDLLVTVYSLASCFTDFPAGIRTTMRCHGQAFLSGC